MLNKRNVSRAFGIAVKTLVLFCALTAPLVFTARAQEDDQIDLDPAKNGVKLVRMAADTKDPFRAGKKFSIHVEIAYVLLDPAGSVGLVVQAKDASGPPLASTKQDVLRGKGKIALKASFMIPKNAKAIQVFTPLFVQGSNSTSTVDGRLIDFKDQEKYLKQAKQEGKPA